MSSNMTCVLLRQVPQTLQDDGLSADCQNYLYKEIREFAQDQYKDLVCSPFSISGKGVDFEANNVQEREVGAVATNNVPVYDDDE